MQRLVAQPDTADHVRRRENGWRVMGSGNCVPHSPYGSTGHSWSGDHTVSSVIQGVSCGLWGVYIVYRVNVIVNAAVRVVAIIWYIWPCNLVSLLALYQVELISTYPDESFIVLYLAGRYCFMLSCAAASLSLSQNLRMSVRLYECLRGCGNYGTLD